MQKTPGYVRVWWRSKLLTQKEKKKVSFEEFFPKINTQISRSHYFRDAFFPPTPPPSKVCCLFYIQRAQKNIFLHMSWQSSWHNGNIKWNLCCSPEHWVLHNMFYISSYTDKVIFLISHKIQTTVPRCPMSSLYLSNPINIIGMLHA